MMKWNVYDKNCPTRMILNRIADKWTVLIVGALAQETKRFNQLRKEVDGISQKMLTQVLRSMERDGLLIRTVYPTIPPKVEYKLTQQGKSLTQLLANIRDWSEQHADYILQAQTRYDKEKVNN